MSGPISFNPGFNGMHAGLDGLQKTASQIASTGAMQSQGPQELARSMIDLKVHANQVDASAMVVKVTDQMLGSILDIKA
ncbi:MAG: hypothetical protein WBO93_04740 [Gammaproteobacteria bacterium]